MAIAMNYEQLYNEAMGMDVDSMLSELSRTVSNASNSSAASGAPRRKLKLTLVRKDNAKERAAERLDDGKKKQLQNSLFGAKTSNVATKPAPRNNFFNNRNQKFNHHSRALSRTELQRMGHYSDFEQHTLQQWNALDGNNVVSPRSNNADLDNMLALVAQGILDEELQATNAELGQLASYLEQQNKPVDNSFDDLTNFVNAAYDVEKPAPMNKKPSGASLFSCGSTSVGDCDSLSPKSNLSPTSSMPASFMNINDMNLATAEEKAMAVMTPEQRILLAALPEAERDTLAKEILASLGFAC